MRITKRQSIVFGLGTLALFFCFGVLMLNRASSIKVAEHAREFPGEAAPQITKEDLDSPVTLNQFHRSEIRDGRKLWEVKADKGRYFPKNNSSALENANIIFFRPDETVVELKAVRAILYISGVDLSRAEASEGVELIYDNKVRIVTESALYDKQSNTVYAPGFVKIMSDRMEISGNILSARVDEHEFNLKENVTSVIKPAEPRKR